MRCKRLNAEYRWKRLPFRLPSNNQIEILAFLGIAKPILAKKLFNLRNRGEHQFEDPPSVGECQELSEFVWYFLRTTDMMLRRIITDVVFDGPHESYHLSGENHPDWRIWVKGTVPQECVKTEPQKGWFELRPQVVDWVDLTTDEAVRAFEAYSEAFENPDRAQKLAELPDDVHKIAYAFLLENRSRTTPTIEECEYGYHLNAELTGDEQLVARLCKRWLVSFLEGPD